MFEKAREPKKLWLVQGAKHQHLQVEQRHSQQTNAHSWEAKSGNAFYGPREQEGPSDYGDRAAAAVLDLGWRGAKHGRCGVEPALGSVPFRQSPI